MTCVIDRRLCVALTGILFQLYAIEINGKIPVEIIVMVVAGAYLTGIVIFL